MHYACVHKLRAYRVSRLRDEGHGESEAMTE